MLGLMAWTRQCLVVLPRPRQPEVLVVAGRGVEAIARFRFSSRSGDFRCLVIRSISCLPTLQVQYPAPASLDQ